MCGNSSGVIIINVVLRTIYCLAISLIAGSIAAEEITAENVKPDTADDHIILEFSPGLGYSERRIPLVGYYADDADWNPVTPKYEPTFGLNLLVDWNRYSMELMAPGHATLGYHLWKTSNHRTTLMFGQTRNSYSPSRVEGYESLDLRDIDQLLGIRSTYARGNHTMKLELYSDIRRGNGEKVMVSLQKNKPWGTWNLKGQVSAEYISSGISNYFYGISTDEAAGLATAYTPGDGLFASAVIELEAPMNDATVFRATYKTSRYPDNIVDSPLVQGQYSYEFSMGVYFVFGQLKLQ